MAPRKKTPPAVVQEAKTEHEQLETQIVAENPELETYKKNIVAYLEYNIISPTLSNLKPEVKMAVVQVTPISMIATRKVGSQDIPYVKVDYMERCLSFVSDQKRGVEITERHFEEREEEVTKENKKVKRMVYEAWVQGNFWMEWNGTKITRSCFGSWKAYENPAVSKFSVLQSALSMATKNFAETFGIASDRKTKESDSINKARSQKKDAIIIEGVETVSKTIEEATEGFSKKQKQDG